MESLNLPASVMFLTNFFLKFYKILNNFFTECLHVLLFTFKLVIMKHKWLAMVDNILGDFFIVLAYFLFTAAERELEYYHQRVNVLVPR